MSPSSLLRAPRRSSEPSVNSRSVRSPNLAAGYAGRLAAIEEQMRSVPGHGGGARLSYRWMLAGDDRHVKPDRMILRWLGRHLGRTVTVGEAHELLIALAERIA